LRLKCTKFDFGWGYTPILPWRSLKYFHGPPAAFQGASSKGEGKGEKEGEREEEEEKGSGGFVTVSLSTMKSDQ